MENILDNFKNYLEALHLNITYYNYIKTFFNYLKSKQINIQNIDNNIIINFINEKNYKPESINLMLKSIRKLYQFLNLPNPITLKYVKVERNYPNFITYKELYKLCNYINDSKFSLILEFLFYTGLRCEEFINLHRNDFDLANNKIIIKHTKTKKDRLIFIPDFLKDKIIQYFNMEQETSNTFNITKYQLQYIIKKCSKYLNKKITPHTFRHSYARYLLDKGVPISIVSKLLGHKQINTTMIYVEPDEYLIRDTILQKIK